MLAGALFALAPYGIARTQGDDDVEVAFRQAPVAAGSAGKETAGAQADVVEYAATYRNQGKVPADSVLASIAVPEGMQYVASSARPAEFLASLDGRMYYAPPLFRVVRRPDGREMRVKVPETDYRVLGWNLDAIAPGATASVSARFRPRQPAGTAGNAAISRPDER
ncbi:MAG: hypothetical protein HYZ17_11595 [Betaproteobacteria bacterium]|nr:hypothetical protein [Betaproteobacteria bacterium]